MTISVLSYPGVAGVISNSPVKIRFDPEQIPRKHFMIFFITIICGEQHTKSLPKSDHHKGSNYDVIKR